MAGAMKLASHKNALGQPGAWRVPVTAEMPPKNHSCWMDGILHHLTTMVETRRFVGI